MCILFSPETHEIICFKVPDGTDVKKLEKELLSTTLRLGQQYWDGKISREETWAKIIANEEKHGMYRFRVK